MGSFNGKDFTSRRIIWGAIYTNDDRKYTSYYAMKKCGISNHKDIKIFNIREEFLINEKIDKKEQTFFQGSNLYFITERYNDFPVSLISLFRTIAKIKMMGPEM